MTARSCVHSYIIRTTPYSSRLVICVCSALNAGSNRYSSRRRLLVGFSAMSTSLLSYQAQPQSNAGDWSSPGLAAPTDNSMPQFYKTDTGVKIQILPSLEEGAAAKCGDKILVDFTLRRANGYFIYGTVEGVSFQPKSVPTGPITVVLGSEEFLPGLTEGLIGIRRGGRRRILVPPELGYKEHPNNEPQMPTFATKRQVENNKNGPLLFEVDRIR